MAFNHPWESIDRFLAIKGIRYGAPTVGQTYGGKHVARSNHGQWTSDPRYKLARDYGIRGSYGHANLMRIFNTLRPYAEAGPNRVLDELLYSGLGAAFYSDGRQYRPSTGNRIGHLSHVHVALEFGKLLTQPPAPKPLVKLTPYDGPFLYFGNGSQWVKEWQYRLTLITGAKLMWDGKYGMKTAAATRNFQKFFGITPTGTVGRRTKAMMNYIISQR